MDDWERLKLDDTFASPRISSSMRGEDGGTEAKMGINAIRSNPNIVGYGMTGCNDPLTYGEGFITAFRELKPGTADAIFDAFYPVRWCTFAEPVASTEDRKCISRPCSANEDAAPPGQYPARLEVVGPDNRKVFDRTDHRHDPRREERQRAGVCHPRCSREDVPIDGPSGKYRFLVTFEKGVAASGGEAEFYVTDPADMPPWIPKWSCGATTRNSSSGSRSMASKSGRIMPGQSNSPRSDSCLLCAERRRKPGSLARPCHADRPRIHGGVPHAGCLQEGRQSAGLAAACEEGRDGNGQRVYVPPGLSEGRMGEEASAVRRVAVRRADGPHVLPRDHPGLSDTGDKTRPTKRWPGPSAHLGPSHHCDLMLSVYNLGAGRFILNSLRVRQDLGQDPTAERLLRNMLNYAARDSTEPLADLPSGFEEQLKAMAY